MNRKEMIQNYCRLCLSSDGSKSIFSKDDGDEVELVERLNVLFNLKYDHNAKFPQKICEKCLDQVEKFSSFVECVHLCEREIKKRFAQLDEMIAFEDAQPCAGLNDCEGAFVPDEENVIIVEVDPFEEVESSDEDFSMDEDEFSEHDQESAAVGYNNRDNKEEQNRMNALQAIEKGMLSSAASLQQPEFKGMSSNDYSTDLSVKNAYLCKICDRAFTSQSECAEHEALHNPTAPYTCNFCQFNCVNRQALIAHIRELHDAERPYICALCRKGFCRRSDLKKHTIVHTGVRPFTCSVCAKSFSRNTNLKKHMRIHSSVKPHVCQHCPRSFCTTSELLRHAVLHTDTKAFSCSHCPASFTRRDKLNAHESTHHSDVAEAKTNAAAAEADTSLLNESSVNGAKVQQPQQNRPLKQFREFNCEICGKSFMRERDLQRHKALHLDSLFTCKQCGSVFARREKLLKHENEAHGSTQFKCTACPAVFTQKNAFDEHMRIHATSSLGSLPPPLNASSATQETTFPITSQYHTEATNKFASFYGQHHQATGGSSMALGFYSEQTGDT